MRIDNNGFDKNAPLPASSSTGAEPAATLSKSGKYDSQDVVAVSDLGSLCSRLSGGIASERAEHVSRLTQQYRAGSYTVDMSALGDALIASAFEG